MSRPSRHPRRWTILGVLILALFGVTLDNTILNIALPTLARDLHAAAGELQWMVDAYVLVFAGLLLVSGAMSDRYGRRRLLVTGLGVFGLGSALAPLVGSATQLILLRGFMGFGAALTMPSTLSIIGDVFDDDERPRAIAAWSAVSGLGIIAGPLLGGWLLEHFAWSSVFLVNVPFVILGVAATLAVVPESRASRAVAIDPIGAGLSVVGLATLVFGVIGIPANGWASPLTIGAIGLGLVVLGAFLAWERRAAEPMLNVRLFADPRFSAASLSIALVFFSLMGALFFLTQYLQGVGGLSAFETGLRFIPIAIGVIVTAPLGAVLTGRLGARVVTAAGLFVVAGGLGLMATLGFGSSDLHVGGVLFVLAAGIGLASTPATDAVMGALPKDQFGVGSAVNDTTRELGGALGVAILGSVFAASYGSAIGVATAGLPADVAGPVGESLAAAGAVAAQLGGAAGDALLGAAQAAFVDAMRLTSLIGVIVAAAGAFVALAFLPARAGRATADAVDVAGVSMEVPELEAA